MMIFLSMVWAKIRGWVIAAGAILAAFWFTYLRGRSNAKGQAQLEQARERSERNANSTNEVARASKDRAEVDADISQLDSGDVNERLRRDWSRSSDRKD